MASTLATPSQSRPDSPTSTLPILWLPTPVHPQALELAQQHFDNITPVDAVRAKEWWNWADACVVTAARLKSDEVAKAKRLKIITRNGVGLDSVPLEVCRQLSIAVTNQPGCNAKAVAEIALVLAINVSRKIATVDRKLKEGERLISQEWRGDSVEGRTVGLVGMGDIARATAKKFYGAFDTPILVYSPTSPPTRWTSQDPSGSIPHERVSSLEELLERSDIVSLHCPLNDDTRNMMSIAQFKRMNKSAILINTARGGLIDEPALVEALRENEIFGAGLDTLVNEPATRSQYPELFSLENVVVLPHVGAQTHAVQRDTCVIAVETAISYLRDGEIGKSTRVL